MRAHHLRITLYVKESRDRAYYFGTKDLFLVGNVTDSRLTIAKPESRADVLLDALSFARLNCSFLQDK